MMLGCEESGGGLTFINRSTQTIYAYPDVEGDPTYALTVPSGGQDDIGTLISAWPHTVKATNELGEQLFSKKYTWSDIKRIDLTIVFTCPSATPSPTRGEVVMVPC